MPKRYQNPKLQKREDVSEPYWFIRVRVPPRPGRSPVRIGYCKDMNQKAAMKERAEVLTRINAGLLVGQARAKVRELVERFRSARIPKLGVAAAARYESVIKNHILPAFGDRQLAEIDKGMVEAWLTGKERDGLSWWSRWGLRGVLSAIFTAGKDWKMWTGDNPAAGVPIGKKRLVREKRLVTTEQFRSILAAVGEQTRFMILIASLVGLRVSEVLGLRWADVDFTARTLTIGRRWYRGDLDDTKTEARKGTRRIGPLAGEFERRYPGPHKRGEYIFLGEDGKTPLDERSVLRYELRPALKKLGLYYPGMGWHIFKRAHITYRQTIGGATPIEAQKAGGHTSVDMTMLYSLSDAEREEEQIIKVFNYLMGAPEGPKQ